VLEAGGGDVGARLVGEVFEDGKQVALLSLA